MDNQSQNKAFPLILGFLFLVVGGWATIIYFPEMIKKRVMIIPVISLVTIGYIYIFIKWIHSPKKFQEDQIKKEKDMQKTAIGRIAVESINAWNVDIYVFRLIFKKFILFLPFITSIILILLSILIPLNLKYDAQFLNTMYHSGSINLYLFSFPILLILHSFAACAFFVLGYISLGYIVRKRYLRINESIFMIFFRFLRLLSFVILLSVAWWVLIIFSLRGKRRESFASSSVNTVYQGLLSAIKLFIYNNIISVSLADEKSSFKETYEFIKKDAYQMLKVWLGSGLLASIIFIMFLVAVAILNKAGILPATESTKGILAPLFFWGLFFVFAFRAFAEQIGLFGIYLKDKYNIDILLN